MSSLRTHFTALPTIAELKKIVEREVKRTIPTGKEAIHYVGFSLAIQLLKHFGLHADFFARTLDFSDVEKENLLEHVHNLGNQVLEKILAHPEYLSLYNQIYDYLAEEDKPYQADLIFVFGAKTPARIEKAIELYHQKLAPKLMLSGGNPFYAPQNISEAEHYRDIALAQEVKAEDIFVETQSITIPDNIGASLNYLNAIKFKLNSLILVNSPYVQRRGWAVFKKHTPDTTKIYRVNSTTQENFSRTNWFKNPDGIKVIFNELVKTKLTVIFNTA